MYKKLEDFEGESVIDSRDLIEAMEEWLSIAEDDDADKEEKDEAQAAYDELKAFCEPFEGYGDWTYGETLISESYWEEYVEEMLKDCGYISPDMPWWIEIDWSKTAENVAIDYTFDNGYYMRSV